MSRTAIFLGAGASKPLQTGTYHIGFAGESAAYIFTLATTEDYLFKEGYAYMSIQWNKVVTDLFGAKVPNELAHNRLCFGTIEWGSGRLGDHA